MFGNSYIAATETCSLQLCLYCLAYTVTSALTDYWVVNWLKLYHIKAPTFCAFVNNSAWPILMAMYGYNSLKQVPEFKMEQIRVYLLLGIIAVFIAMSKMLGLTALPPTLSIICSNTEIIFEALMTRVVLGRHVRLAQWTAVFLVMCSVFVALYNPETKQYGRGDAQTSPSALLVGVIMSVASRFASSLNNILAEKMLGQDSKTMQGAMGLAITASVGPFLLIPLVFYKKIGQEYWAMDLKMDSMSQNAVVIVAFLFTTLSLAKICDRVSKFAIVGSATTIFFAGVDANTKMIGGIGSFIFFNEIITWANIVGFLFAVSAVSLLYFDKLQQSTPAAKAALASAATPVKKRVSRDGIFLLFSNIEVETTAANISLPDSPPVLEAIKSRRTFSNNSLSVGIGMNKSTYGVLNDDFVIP